MRQEGKGKSKKAKMLTNIVKTAPYKNKKGHLKKQPS